MMRSAGEGHVPAAGYATMVLLQQVCHCDADTPSLLEIKQRHDVAVQRGPPPEAWNRLSPEQQKAVTLWSRLADGTRHAITPYLSLRAEQTEKPKSVASPIYTPGAVYSDWVVKWCRQLLAFTARLRDAVTSTSAPFLDQLQKSRATLLVAGYACVRFDPSLALSMVPLAINFLLKASPQSNNGLDGVTSRTHIIGSLVNEIEAVLVQVDQSSSDAPDAEHLLCCQAIFEIFDTMDNWRELHRKRNESEELAAVNTLMTRISHMKLARAALRAGAHCRALRYFEHLADQSSSCRPKPQNFHGPGMIPRELPSADAAALMHAVPAYRRARWSARPRAYASAREPRGGANAQQRRRSSTRRTVAFPQR